jgi:hypothetical protein
MARVLDLLCRHMSMPLHPPMARMIVCGLWTVALWTAASAAEKKAAAPTVRGTLVAKTEESIDVLPEGEKRAQRFELVSPGAVLDPRAAAFSRGLALGSEVQVTWTRDRGGRRVTNLSRPAVGVKLGLDFC